MQVTPFEVPNSHLKIRRNIICNKMNLVEEFLVPDDIPGKAASVDSESVNRRNADDKMTKLP
jgi:hypothetical protein